MFQHNNYPYLRTSLTAALSLVGGGGTALGTVSLLPQLSKGIYGTLEPKVKSTSFSLPGPTRIDCLF